jgi:hypothetical protein
MLRVMRNSSLLLFVLKQANPMLAQSINAKCDFLQFGLLNAALRIRVAVSSGSEPCLSSDCLHTAQYFTGFDIDIQNE